MTSRQQQLATIAGALVALIVIALTNGRFPPLTAPIINTDIDQHRVNSAAPILEDGLQVEQTFVANRHGLSGVNVLLVRYDGVEQNDNSFLTVELLDDQGQVISSRTVLTEELEHNHMLRLTFDPIRDAYNRQFVIRASGGENTAFSVWGYSLDVYEAGGVALSDDSRFTAVQDLRFTTQYNLVPQEVWRYLTHVLLGDGLILLLSLLVLPLPGALALLAYSPSWRWERWAYWGTAVALGIAIWPIFWFYTSLVGLRWTSGLLWGVVVLGWLIYLRFTILRHRSAQVTDSRRISRRTSTQPPIPNPQSPIPNYQLPIILLASLAVRLLTVRDLAFPPWVDSTRHAVITAVMMEKGQVLTNYAPFLPVDNFPYHFGFHTLSTTLMLMGGFELERFLLIFGQLLNGLVPLSIYTAVYFLTRRRETAVFCAFLVAFPFFFPGYYATWGRFTQLTGMIIMPVLLVKSWLLIRGGQVWRATWWMVGLLAAGLFLVHFRVFLLYVPFAILIWGFGWRKNSRWFEMAGAITIGLVGIRAFALIQLNRAQLATAGTEITNYNAFPTAYLNAGWDQYFIWLGVGLIPLLLLGVVGWRRWGYFPLVLVVWTAVLFGLIWGDIFNFASRSVINLNSMYIILFAPFVMVIGVILAQFNRWGSQLPWWGTAAKNILLGAVTMVLLLFGARLQVEILNPVTILGRPADAKAITWLDDNLSDEAQVAVSSWLWLGNTWAGQDGGAWITPLTGRLSSTPPADYIYDLGLLQRVNGFNDAASKIEDWSLPETAVWLQEQGMTHLFVGAGGGFFQPEQLIQNPNIELLYSQDGAFVFGIK